MSLLNSAKSKFLLASIVVALSIIVISFSWLSKQRFAYERFPVKSLLEDSSNDNPTNDTNLSSLLANMKGKINFIVLSPNNCAADCIEFANEFANFVDYRFTNQKLPQAKKYKKPAQKISVNLLWFGSIPHEVQSSHWQQYPLAVSNMSWLPEKLSLQHNSTNNYFLVIDEALVRREVLVLSSQKSLDNSKHIASKTFHNAKLFEFLNDVPMLRRQR